MKARLKGMCDGLGIVIFEGRGDERTMNAARQIC